MSTFTGSADTLGGCNPQESQDLAVIHAVGLLYWTTSHACQCVASPHMCMHARNTCSAREARENSLIAPAVDNVLVADSVSKQTAVLTSSGTLSRVWHSCTSMRIRRTTWKYTHTARIKTHAQQRRARIAAVRQSPEPVHVINRWEIAVTAGLIARNAQLLPKIAP